MHTVQIDLAPWFGTLIQTKSKAMVTIPAHFVTGLQAIILLTILLTMDKKMEILSQITCCMISAILNF